MIFFTLVVQREEKDGAEARGSGKGTGRRKQIFHTFTLSLCCIVNLQGNSHRYLVDILQTFFFLSILYCSTYPCI